MKEILCYYLKFKDDGALTLIAGDFSVPPSFIVIRDGRMVQFPIEKESFFSDQINMRVASKSLEILADLKIFEARPIGGALFGSVPSRGITHPAVTALAGGALSLNGAAVDLSEAAVGVMKFRGAEIPSGFAVVQSVSGYNNAFTFSICVREILKKELITADASVIYDGEQYNFLGVKPSEFSDNGLNMTAELHSLSGASRLLLQVSLDGERMAGEYRYCLSAAASYKLYRKGQLAADGRCRAQTVIKGALKIPGRKSVLNGPEYAEAVIGVKRDEGKKG
ncbi:MAG: hypothetical protein LBS99_06145 [Clostridiales bacterium]|nr:hypothetical protein [Clostridiales bacterium]